MQCSLKHEFPVPFQTPDIGVNQVVANFLLSQHCVYKNALFLIIKTRAMPESFLGNQRKVSPSLILNLWIFDFVRSVDINSISLHIYKILS